MERGQQHTTSQSLETGLNHPPSGITAEQSSMQVGIGALNDSTGRTVTPENGNSVNPGENMPMPGPYHASQRDLEMRPFEHSSSSTFGGSTVHASLSSPSDNLLLDLQPSGRSYLAPENNTAHPNFGNPNRHAVHEVERGLHDHTIDIGRGQPKRIRFGISSGYGRGCTNRYGNPGSSSNSVVYGRGNTSRHEIAGSSSNSLVYGIGSANRYENAGNSINSVVYERSSTNRYENPGSSSNSNSLANERGGTNRYENAGNFSSPLVYQRGNTNRYDNARSSSSPLVYERRSTSRYENVGSSSNSLANERGSTSRYENAGSSTNSLEFPRDEPAFGFQNYPSSSIVRRRSRYRLDTEVNPSTDVRSREVSPRRTHSTNNDPTVHNPSSPEEVDGSVSEATNEDLNRFATFSALYERFLSGSSGLRRETNRYSARGSAADFTGHTHDSISNRNSILPPSHIQGRQGQAAGEGSNRYSQRTIPSFRTGLGTANSERAVASENHLHFHPESYSSSSVGGRHSTLQDPMTRTAVFRFEPPLNTMNVRDRVNQRRVNPSSVPGNLLDQHRGMRLDIDNLSYEELISLGESIGSVGTGLAHDEIPKCLVKATYSTLDDDKKEGFCVICQENYKDMEEVATIKNCGHDYHTECIGKWLLIKNTCPICQGTALELSEMED